MSNKLKNNKNRATVSKKTYQKPITYREVFLTAGFSLLIYGLSQFLVTFVTYFIYAIYSFVTKKQMPELNALLDGSLNVVDNTFGALLLVSMLFSAFITIGILCIFAIKKNEFPIQKISGFSVTRFLGYGAILNLMISALLSAIPNIENIQANQTLEQSLNSILNNNPALVMISAGFFVPIMEEFVFRYGICGSIAKKNKLCGIIVSALIFGILHGNLIQSTYAFLLGLLFAFIYVQSGNLIYPILLHIGINFSSSVAGTLFENEYIGMSVCIGITLVMILVSVLLQIIMKKNGKTLQEDVWEFRMFKKK